MSLILLFENCFEVFLLVDSVEVQVGVSFGQMCYLHNHMDNHFFEQTSLGVCLCNVVLNINQCCCCLTPWSLSEFLKIWWRRKWQKTECINTLTILLTPPPCKTKRKIRYHQYRSCSFPSVRPWNIKKEEKMPFSSQWTQPSDQDVFSFFFYFQ